MRTNNCPRKSLIFIGLLAASLTVGACGSGGGTLNQGVPNGTVVSQGSFTAQACVGGAVPSVVGSAVLYSQGGGSYAVNLSGLTISGGGCAAYGVYVLAGSYVFCGPLTSLSVQSANVYCTGLASQPTSAVLHCTNQAAPAAFDCAVANLL